MQYTKYVPFQLNRITKVYIHWQWRHYIEFGTQCIILGLLDLIEQRCVVGNYSTTKSSCWYTGTLHANFFSKRFCKGLKKDLVIRACCLSLKKPAIPTSFTWLILAEPTLQIQDSPINSSLLNSLALLNVPYLLLLSLFLSTSVILAMVYSFLCVAGWIIIRSLMVYLVLVMKQTEALLTKRPKQVEASKKIREAQISKQRPTAICKNDI